MADAAVTVHRPSPDDARLAAFVVAASGPVPRPDALRERLAAVLPAHLVPDEVQFVDALPLTPSGKVDRRALTDLVHGGRARHSGRSARSPGAGGRRDLEPVAGP